MTEELAWALEAKGVLRLIGTRITVVQHDVGGAFSVCVDGRSVRGAGNLSDSKEHALRVMREALEMGHEP